jgi:hypothetical protein
MNRPLVGVVLLVLAVVTVTVVPMIDGRRVSGAATAVVFPAPPLVGDCVVSPFPADKVLDGIVPEIPVTEVTFGSCSGAKIGEVVALSDDVSVARSSSLTAARGPCFREIATYAGLQLTADSVMVPGASTRGLMTWLPTIGTQAFVIAPSRQERTAGHHWAACVAASTRRAEYRGSLRSAYTTGTLPDQFGLCWAKADLDLVPDLLRCDQPHPAELLATGWIGDRSLMSIPDIQAACRVTAGEIMRTPDPTRGGAITVVLDQVTLDGATTPNDPLMVGCLVTASGNAELTGTVIGLGDRPAPLQK